MAKLNLSPPWQIYVNELEQLFKYDQDVHVVFDESNYEVKLYVDSSLKAGALMMLLPDTKLFGNVILTITVVPANEPHYPDAANPYQVAFSGNGAYSYIKTVKGVFTNDITYVVFVNRVVQFYTDDLGDIHGLRSTLYQDIAKDVFGEKTGVFFCTDVEEQTGVRKPLGEWP